ncbi:unnamed protein product [Microthlaspi erraticum]|uniref:Reverse transcriptase domain-containing protein n=1 Tax=Microthlaspi erraticum TaxID=1685480 RepID=A0A6D2ICV8_9BRAS|nr:unnamed protein product [Microthlaspi erraticum]
MIFSFIYAANVEALRNELWEELVSLSTDARVVGKAWAVLGDFNQVLHPNEHSALDGFTVDRATRDFRQSILNSELADLNFRGSTYTWWNKRRVNPVAKKLDRVLVNDLWLEIFPTAMAFFGAPDFSDHSSCGIALSPSVQRQKKAFKFYNYLLGNPDFIAVICSEWFSLNFVGSDMFRVSKKLKALKKNIRDFSRENYSGLEKRVKEAHQHLLDRQVATLESPTPSNAHLELLAQQNWEVLAEAEERLFRQRSRVTWLKEGDMNTAYFHRIMKSRNSMNVIHFLEDEIGNRIESPQAIHAHCVDYFEGLLSGAQSQPMFVQEDITSLLDFSCSMSQRSQLDSCFSSEEIKEAFLSLPKNKTCGPDGFTPEFFTSCWTVVGGEVTAAVKEFFSSEKLLKQWNATNLVLIPKITNASRTTDFRPISCLNTLYKVISKLLAKRLKSVLPSVISHSQSAFLLGRLLSENVLLATEIVQGYNMPNVSPRGMLKVDLRKDFDSVRWDFVISVLKGLNMPDKFVGWISECLTTPCFYVSVNGVEGGFFKSSRGLRQGDPISPYLFVLVMEVFSKLLQSRNKTELFTAGMSQIESAAIANYGFPIGSFPIRYLGLPLTCRKLRISEYSPLVEKLSKQFTTWSVRTLSFAGRLQLISSVIMGSVNFWSSTFILPKGCIRQIESLCSRFL